MIPMFLKSLLCLFLVAGCVHSATAFTGGEAIHSGVAWFDQNGRTVSARGAGVVKEGGHYYLFGEFKQDHGNAFSGVSCYSSSDLNQWTFEGIALPVQKEGPLGPNRVGERPKVMKCPKTGEFVMYLHTDDSAYRDQAVGYATSATIRGPYTFRGPLLFNGSPIKKWDMGVFQDEDGAGYVITHSGNLYRLSDDYRSATVQIVKDMTPGFESPAIFKRNGRYYWLGSGLTAWERNDNEYFMAASLAGPWEPQGTFAPKGTLTWNSQTTFVMPIVGSEATTFVFMGDRWAHPRQNSAATYVWQPLQFDSAGRMSLPEFRQSWKVDTLTGQWAPVPLRGKVTDIRVSTGVRYNDAWKAYTDAKGLSDLRSDLKDATLTVEFKGTQVGLYGVARPDGGFGEVQIKDRAGNVVLSSVMETYCLYPEASLKFLSPKLKQGEYTLTVRVLGEHFFWQAKRAAYGSTGDYVSVQKLLVVDAD